MIMTMLDDIVSEYRTTMTMKRQRRDIDDDGDDDEPRFIDVPL